MEEGGGGGGGGGEILLNGEGEEEENVEIEEEMIEEMMRCLEREINSPTTSDYGGVTSIVTINGNEESCGPSFSDSASTMMASVDTRGVGSVDYFAAWPSDPAEVVAATVKKGVELWDGELMPQETAITTATCGAAVEEEEEEDDDWFARVVGGAGVELELDDEENLFAEKVGRYN